MAKLQGADETLMLYELGQADESKCVFIISVWQCTSDSRKMDGAV